MHVRTWTWSGAGIVAAVSALAWIAACDSELVSESEGSEPGQCGDGIDNDDDGLTDCDDWDCAEMSECAGDDDDTADDDDDTGDDDDDIVPAPCDELCINEFMASNASTITDDTGAFPDWIELFNPTGADVTLDGYAITDDVGEPQKFVLGGGLVVPAGGYLLLWADRDVDQGDDHLSFALSKDGEQIAIYDRDGARLDALEYEAQTTDLSQARIPDGSDEWQYEQTPTPGASNG